MLSQLTLEAQQAVLAAKLEAKQEGRRHVSPAHLLLGALDCSAMPAAAVTAEAMRMVLPDILFPGGPQNAPLALETAAARAVLSLDVEPHLL